MARWCILANATSPRSVSRAPLSKIEAFKKAHGLAVRWVSSFGTDFNYDYRASFTQDEMAQGRVAYTSTSWNSPVRKRRESVFSTRIRTATFSIPIRLRSRDRKRLSNTYNYLDLVPKAGMRMACPSRWHGFAITIATGMAT